MFSVFYAFCLSKKSSSGEDGQLIRDLCPPPRVQPAGAGTAGVAGVSCDRWPARRLLFMKSAELSVLIAVASRADRQSGELRPYRGSTAPVPLPPDRFDRQPSGRATDTPHCRRRHRHRHRPAATPRAVTPTGGEAGTDPSPRGVPLAVSELKGKWGEHLKYQRKTKCRPGKTGRSEWVSHKTQMVLFMTVAGDIVAPDTGP